MRRRGIVIDQTSGLPSWHRVRTMSGIKLYRARGGGEAGTGDLRHNAEKEAPPRARHLVHLVHDIATVTGCTGHGSQNWTLSACAVGDKETSTTGATQTLHRSQALTSLLH